MITTTNILLLLILIALILCINFLSILIKNINHIGYKINEYHKSKNELDLDIKHELSGIKSHSRDIRRYLLDMYALEKVKQKYPILFDRSQWFDDKKKKK